MNYLAMALDPTQILTAKGLPADPIEVDPKWGEVADLYLRVLTKPR
jgi:hypothetical protein